MRGRGRRSSADEGVVCTSTGHEIATPRLLLKTLGPEDIDAVIVDDEVIRWMGYPGEPTTLRSFMSLSTNMGSVTWPYIEEFGIFERSTNDLIGVRSLSQAPRAATLPQHLKTGGWLDRNQRGQGFGAEELGATLRFAHDHLGHACVVAGTETSNVRAHRLYQDAGFETYAEMLHTLPDGRSIPAVWMRHDQRKVHRRCAQRIVRRKSIEPSFSTLRDLANRVAATYDHDLVDTEDMAIAAAQPDIRDEIDPALPTTAELAALAGWNPVPAPNFEHKRSSTVEVLELLMPLLAEAMRGTGPPVTAQLCFDALAASDTPGGELLRKACAVTRSEPQ
ncbi:MAG: GNAT family N-acetyltransferase [Acidimicrobiia bacterium]